MEQLYNEAAIEFERAIELDPTLFDARYYYGRACFKGGELEKSLHLFEQAQKLRSDDYESVYLIGLVLMQLGRANEARNAQQDALKHDTKYIDLNPDDTRTYIFAARR